MNDYESTDDQDDQDDPYSPYSGGLIEALRKVGEGRPSGSSGGSGTNLPSLGDDILDIRLRAKAAAAAAAATETAATSTRQQLETPEATEARLKKLRLLHQVDLNDEKNIADLEDEGLEHHRRKARQILKAGLADQAALPSASNLLRDDTATRRALSSLMANLKEAQMALQCAIDEVHAHASNALKLTVNEQPHSYPPVGPDRPTAAMVKCLNHLEKKVMSAVGDLNRTSEMLNTFERDLTLTRRNYETVVDGLRRRDEYYMAAYAEISNLASGGSSGAPMKNED